MSALIKLQEKIAQWKSDHEALKAENADLKNQLAGAANAQQDKEALNRELETKAHQCQTLESTVSSLQQELREKDEEIEKIIAQVESLLA